MSTRLIVSEAEWHALRDEWDPLVVASTYPSIFLTFDYLKVAFQTFHGGVSAPFLIVIRNDEGDLLGIAPFRRTRQRRRGIPLSVIEYLTTWEIDKPYIIARSGNEEHCWGEIYRYLHEHPSEWDVLDLMEVPSVVGGARLIPQLFRAPDYKCTATPGPDGPIFDLSMQWPDFLGRHANFARAVKRLEKLPDGYQIQAFDRPETIREGLEHYMSLERKSWKHGQHGLEKNRWHIDFYQAILPVLAVQQRVAIRTLTTGDQLLAAVICYEFGDTVYIHHTVYNSEFSRLSPGKLIMGLTVRDYMTAGNFRAADPLCGFADYYKPWTTSIVETSRIQVHRMSVKTRLMLRLDRLRDFLSRRGAQARIENSPE